MLNQTTLPAHLQATGDIHKETFAALMDLYENNYLRLKKLLPELSRMQGEHFSTVVGCLDLKLEILEHSRFTSEIILSYQFQRDQVRVAEPNLHIRLYHDVAMAEVLSGQLQHGRLRISNLPQTAISKRWQLNRFLYKWLGFCLHLGHQFGVSVDAENIKHRVNRILAEKIS